MCDINFSTLSEDEHKCIIQTKPQSVQMLKNSINKVRILPKIQVKIFFYCVN